MPGYQMTIVTMNLRDLYNKCMLNTVYIARQTKAEMARPGERGFDQNSDDGRDGRRQNTLTCHDLSQHTTIDEKSIFEIILMHLAYHAI